MKAEFFYFLLAAVILFLFQIFPSAAQENICLPDISILNIENPVPQERGAEKSLGHEWVTVELKNYKVYYLPEKGFPEDDITYANYMKNIDFLLPRLDNVYVFLSKWINVDLGRKLGVYYIADRNQLMVYSLANNIHEKIDKILKKSEDELKNNPDNQYWSYMHNMAKSLREKNKEVKDVMNRVVGKESILLDIMQKGEQAAVSLFNNNPSYLAQIMDINLYDAQQWLKFEKFSMKCAQFPLFQYGTYFNYAEDTPVIDLHESCHIFTVRKQCGGIDEKFLHEPLCHYFGNKTDYLFNSLKGKESGNYYQKRFADIKNSCDFDRFLQGSPFAIKGQDIREIWCAHFIYIYLEQKDRVKFYDFLQLMLGDKDKNIKPLSAQYAIYKSYGLTLDELYKRLKVYYDTGVVE